MHFIHAIILGVVEGVTEFLPISSTGHLILIGQLLHIPDTDFLKSFDIIIQLGAILAVVALYFRTLFLNLRVFKLVALAFIPTGVIGLLLYKIIKTYLLGNTSVVLFSLLIGGLAIVMFERLYAKKTVVEETALTAITYKQAVLIGLFQSIAIIPGVSRSAATIVGGMSLGLSRRTIVEFSFLLAIPTMVAATGLDLIKNIGLFHRQDVLLLAIGFITALISAFIAVKFLLKYIRTHSFTAFGFYRIVLVLVLLAFL